MAGDLALGKCMRQAQLLLTELANTNTGPKRWPNPKWCKSGPVPSVNGLLQASPRGSTMDYMSLCRETAVVRSLDLFSTSDLQTTCFGT